ncbi:MAG: hypothetical protein MOB07_17445 [Acidobacteria bacterium]|nr:hypothetical protein [Acidobacteriota bacterium]
MFNYEHDKDPYDHDEQFYRETVYNEEYYLEQEQEMIRQSNLEFELEKLEDESIREMREEDLLRLALVKSGEQRAENSAQVNYQDDRDDLPF